MNNPKRFALVLHSHLPHVLNHGRWPHGSDWLCEVACETYLQLIKAVEELRSEGIKARITIGLTPVLCEQLASSTFKREFAAFLASRTAAAITDEAWFRTLPYEKHLAPLAAMWGDYYREAKKHFDGLGGDIIGAFRRLEEEGYIEVIGSAATHAYLPLLYDDKRVREQIRVGLETHKKHFGRKPDGFWLPECGYRPTGQWQRPIAGGGEVSRAGIEEMLAAEGVKYFIVDSHLVTHSRPLGTYKQLIAEKQGQIFPEEKTSGAPTHRSYLVGMGPVACFVRDAACGLQVWSGEHGYPGDPAYLEFHKRRWPGGLRYWRVTSGDKDLGTKAPYDPAAALRVTSLQAWHFVGMVKWAVREGGIICAPYDAELFGHWWHEGAEWLKETYRLIAADKELDAVTLNQDLKEHPPADCIALSSGSWGAGGGDDVWLNSGTDWIWNKLYPLAERLESVLSKHQPGKDEELDALAEAARRQLLFAEASDWPFLITTGHVKDYAERRFNEHSSAVKNLLDAYERALAIGGLGPGDGAELKRLNNDDFPFIGLL